MDEVLIEFLADVTYVVLLGVVIVRCLRGLTIGSLLYVLAIVSGSRLILAWLDLDPTFIILRSIATIVWILLADRYWDREHPIDITSKM